MSAYVISEVDVRDAAGFEAYRTIAAKSIAHYGGRYLVRGGAANAAEGGPPPKTIIVVEFPSMERLRSPPTRSPPAEPPVRLISARSRPGHTR